MRLVPKACFAGVKKPAVDKRLGTEHPSFQVWQYWLDWGLLEDARGSVRDNAVEVEKPEAV